MLVIVFDFSHSWIGILFAFFFWQNRTTMEGSTQGGGILVSSSLRDMWTHYVKCMVSLAKWTYFLTCIKQSKTIAIDAVIILESLEKLGSSARAQF